MKNKPFTIKQISAEEQRFVYTADIDVNHPIFEGHFPNMGVVPGVCTMDMIKCCLSDSLGRDVRYDSIKECKFLSAIIPTQHKTVNIDISIKNEDSHLVVNAEVTVEDIKMMKLKATLI